MRQGPDLTQLLPLLALVALALLALGLILAGDPTPPGDVRPAAAEPAPPLQPAPVPHGCEDGTPPAPAVCAPSGLGV